MTPTMMNRALAFAPEILSVSLVTWLLLRILRARVHKPQNSIDNIPGPENSSILAGNLQQFFAPNSWGWHTNNIARYGRVMRLWGPFRSKLLWVSDPLALHHIFVKDIYIYEEPKFLLENSRITLGKGLLSVTGDVHKRQRKMLNPIFSTKHMKFMIPIFYDIAKMLRGAIAREVADGPREVDMLMWVSRTALELVGVAGLGYSFESFDNDSSPSLYAKAVKEFQPAMMQKTIILGRRVLLGITSHFPDAITRFIVDHIPFEPLQKIKNLVDIMYSTSIEVVEQKRRALKEGDEATLHQIGQGKDIISILLRANMEAAPEDRLPEEEVIGQMSTLIFAAFDTTSSALSRILHLLAEHIDVQEKLREEVTAAQQDGDLDLERLFTLPYLEAVCRETLRMHAPVPNLTREVLQDVVLPLSTPIKGNDGSELNSVLLPAGSFLMTGLLACNTDRLIWGEDAHEWKPERWLKPLPESVTDARIPGVYANLMTFSGGGRSCIGFKFSQLEMKVVLAVLLRSFKFEPAEGKEIHFNMAGIQWPQVVDGPNKPALPLKVSLVQHE